MNAEAKLSRREAEFTELAAWGATKKDIALRCFVSVRTVENTFRNVFAKTGVTKVNELSAWWFCFKYNISHELSPLKKKCINLAALMKPRHKIKDILKGLWFGISIILLMGEPAEGITWHYLAYYGFSLLNMGACVIVLNKKLKPKRYETSATTK